MDSGAVGDPSTPEFQFEARRARLDWRLLHAVDVDRLMRENDIDTLETTLVRPRVSPDARFAISASTTTSAGPTATRTSPSIPSPPLRRRPWRSATSPSEDSRNAPTTNNARKIIRLAQCQVEYLLHVQETLVHHDRTPSPGRRSRAARRHRRQVQDPRRARQGARDPRRASPRQESAQDVRGARADPRRKTPRRDPHRRRPRRRSRSRTGGRGRGRPELPARRRRRVSPRSREAPPEATPAWVPPERRPTCWRRRRGSRGGSDAGGG